MVNDAFVARTRRLLKIATLCCGALLQESRHNNDMSNLFLDTTHVSIIIMCVTFRATHHRKCRVVDLSGTLQDDLEHLQKLLNYENYCFQVNCIFRLLCRCSRSAKVPHLIISTPAGLKAKKSPNKEGIKLHCSSMVGCRRCIMVGVVYFDLVVFSG